VFGEAQIPDHLGIQQADRVTRGGVAESGVEFLGDRGTSEDRTAFEYAHGKAGFGEVTSAGEAVVTTPDDDDIEAGFDA
jgi:hypothetical protein